MFKYQKYLCVCAYPGASSKLLPVSACEGIRSRCELSQKPSLTKLPLCREICLWQADFATLRSQATRRIARYSRYQSRPIFWTLLANRHQFNLLSLGPGLIKSFNIMQLKGLRYLFSCWPSWLFDTRCKQRAVAHRVFWAATYPPTLSHS